MGSWNLKCWSILARLITKKRNSDYKYQVWDDINIDSTDIKKIKEYCKQLYVDILDN